MPLKSSLGNKEERREKLTRVLQSTYRDEICNTCIDNLDKYIAAQLAGEDYLALFPDVALHLDSCVNCSEIYSRLYELEVAEIEGAIKEPQSPPQPDLAFISQKESVSPIDKILDFLDKSLKRREEIISIQFSSTLISLLKPSTIPISTRSEAMNERYAEIILEISSDRFPGLNLPFSLIAYQDRHEPAFCLVEVQINIQGLHWPDLGGRTVYLIIGKTKREATTDPGGVASFEGVLISDLDKVEIQVNLQTP